MNAHDDKGLSLFEAFSFPICTPAHLWNVCVVFLLASSSAVLSFATEIDSISLYLLCVSLAYKEEATNIFRGLR